MRKLRHECSRDLSKDTNLGGVPELRLGLGVLCVTGLPVTRLKWSHRDSLQEGFVVLREAGIWSPATCLQAVAPPPTHYGTGGSLVLVCLPMPQFPQL